MKNDDQTWFERFHELFAEYFGDDLELQIDMKEPTKAEIDRYIEYLEREFAK